MPIEEGMIRPLAAVAALAVAVVVATAVPSAGDDDEVTWDQVRSAMAAAPGRHREPAPPPAGIVSVTVPIVVTIPDLSWALDDPTAPDGVRRAACHQATGPDDETAGPLAACLRHVRGQHGNAYGHDKGGHHGPRAGRD